MTRVCSDAADWNVEGNAEVTASHIGTGCITLEFSGGSSCGHVYASAGREDVERMKGLIAADHGRESAIKPAVSGLYERKEQ